MDPSGRVQVSSHAIDRAIERKGWKGRSAVRRRLEELWLAAVVLPLRYAKQLRWSTRPRGDPPEFRVVDDLILLRRSQTLVTCGVLEGPGLAAVEGWLTTGEWTPPELRTP